MQKTIRQTVYALTIALLLPATFAAAESTNQAKLRKEAVQLTKQIEGAARKIQNESDHLTMMRKNHNISNFSHRQGLLNIATHVNGELSPALDRLAEIQPHLPEWHQQAIDQMRTSAANLAAHANAAVTNRSNDGTRKPAILDSEYSTLLGGMNNHATNLVQVADAAADYGNAQLKGHQAGLAIASHQ